jgi:hypothetical protein
LNQYAYEHEVIFSSLLNDCTVTAEDIILTQQKTQEIIAGTDPVNANAVLLLSILRFAFILVTVECKSANEKCSWDSEPPVGIHGILVQCVVQQCLHLGCTASQLPFLCPKDMKT